MRPLRPARVTALAFVAALAALSSAAAIFPFESGELVRVDGVVTDSAGRPISGLDVVLEASRAGFALQPLGRVKRDLVRGTTRTDAAGRFALEMRWSPRYNQFEVLAGVPLHRGSDEHFEVLARLDITRKLKQGSPVVAPLILSDTSLLDALRGFLASLESADEKRVYQEQGKPDRVDRVELPQRREVSWWYFERGKVYRFVDGVLRQVDDFAPVEPL